MGILNHHIHILSMEQEQSKMIRGDVLTIGQQSVWLNIKEAKRIFSKYAIKLNSVREDFDYSNKIKAWEGTDKSNNLSAQGLLTIMGANSVSSIDISDHEDADIIHDLNYPISEKLYSTYDFIYDGGSLEHIFDVPMALQNISKLLRVKGSLLIAVPSSNSIDHGFYSFSPTLFFDYFNANGFSNIRAYLREGSSRVYKRKGRLFKYTHTGKEIPIVSPKSVELIVLAQKTSKYNSSNIKKPIQTIYQVDESWNKTSNTSIPTDMASQRETNIKKFKNLVISLMKYLPYEFERIIFNKFRSSSLDYIGRY